MKRPRAGLPIPSDCNSAVRIALGDSDYFTADLLGARTRPPAELIEHTIEHGGATLMNQADFFFLVRHWLEDPLKQQREDKGRE